MASIRFLGAAGTVTGSRYLVEAAGRRVLVDAGLFQGMKEFRLRNWAPFPVPPDSIDAVVLTHAHIDHSGALPLLCRAGFPGEAFCTPATADLARIMLPDAAKLQEEEARYANAKGYSRHAPRALPLYEAADAAEAIGRLRTLRYGKLREILPGFTLGYSRAGHILGSASATLTVAAASGPPIRIVFSGDLGRYDAPILPDPEPPPACDFLVVESTYGDRTHPPDTAAASLEQEVLAAVARGGAILIPAFAIGRTQEVLFLLRELEQSGRIPSLPVFVDSPMATDATPVYRAHREDHDTHMDALLDRGVEPLCPRRLTFTRSTEESKAVNRVHGPCIIISASGMATGGRVLHHLERRLPEPSTTVLLVGFQAAGTRGWRLQNGAETIRMHGTDVPVRARVVSLPGFSAHGDRNEVARWLDGAPTPPRRTFCVHGEPTALSAQAERIAARGWEVHVPSHLETVELG
jgi:metallo-beta-lactamase family protein